MSASTMSPPYLEEQELWTPDVFFSNSTTVQKGESDTYIAEYLRTSNKQIWIDKLRTCLKSIPDAQLSKISVRELVSSAPVFSAWSCDASRALSRRWLSLTATDSPASVSTYSSFFSTHVMLSWSLTQKLGATKALTMALQMDPNNWLKTSWLSSTFSRAESTEREVMGTNVSETKESLAYRDAKAIAMWYLNKRKDEKENPRWMDLPVEEARKMKDLEDEQDRQRKAEEKKRKAEQAVLADAHDSNDTHISKKRRTKYRTTASEEKKHWEEKVARRIARKAVDENQALQHIKETEEKDPTSMRSMSFRFYPSIALQKGLLGWLDIADAIDIHVKEVMEDFATKGEKVSFRYLRDEYICLTKERIRRMEKEGTLKHIRDLDRRRAYVTMPYDVQQAIVKESVANFTANQTNYERGNNTGFVTRQRDATRRWKTLKFLATGMCVNKETGEVTMYPRNQFVEDGGDRGVYIKDRLVRFLSEWNVRHTSRLPTKHWGRYLQCGKDKGGRAFTIRYDTTNAKWYLILSYDARIRGAPFRSDVCEALSSDTRACTKRARVWIARQGILFSPSSGVKRGNMCAIDPGSRTPWTCFDVQRRSFYDVYPDLVGALANHHNEVAYFQSQQSVTSQAGNSDPYIALRQKKRKRRKRDAKKTRKRKRNWKPPFSRQVQHKYDLMKATVRHAHNAFANHLVRTYDVIVLPEFMTAGMVRKRRKQMKLPPMKEEDGVNRAPREGKFTLHKTTRKAMRWISHYAFRQRLLAKALTDPFEIKDIICTTEEYTTKQCPFCDFVHHKIGSNKEFKCGNAECGFLGRRDNVGAFNISLRSIVKGEVTETL